MIFYKYFWLSFFVLYCSAMGDGFPISYYSYNYVPGCRQNSMGGAGYSFPKDENVLFFNPAGLGLSNNRFKNIAGALGYTFQPNSDFFIQSHDLSLCTQPFKKYISGFAFQSNHHYYVDKETIQPTKQVMIDSLLYIIPDMDKEPVRDYFIISQYMFGFGTSLPFVKKSVQALGISIKHFRNYHKIFYDPIKANCLQLDFGYNGIFMQCLHTGFSVLHIPVIAYDFNRENLQLTPLRINTSIGLSYPRFNKKDNHPFSFFSEIYNSILTKKHWDGFNIQKYGYGIECMLARALYLRQGTHLTFHKYTKNSEYNYLNHLNVSYGIGFKLGGKSEIQFFHSIKNYKSIETNKTYNREHQIGTSINLFGLAKK